MNKLYALFNKKTRQFSTFSLDISWATSNILDSLLYKEFPFDSLNITGDEINLSRFKWIGDYDSGRLVDIVSENKSVVTEKELDEKYRAIFWKRYNMEEIIYQLILNCDMKTEQGQEIKNFLKTVLNRKEKDIDFFKNSPVHIWESYDDMNKAEKNAFKS